MDFIYPEVLTKEFIMEFIMENRGIPDVSLFREYHAKPEALDRILTTLTAISFDSARVTYNTYLDALKYCSRVEHLHLLMRHTKLAAINGFCRWSFVFSAIHSGKTDVLEVFLDIMREEKIFTEEFFQRLLEERAVVSEIPCLRILIRYAREFGYTQIQTTNEVVRCILNVRDPAVFDELFLFGFDVMTRVTGKSFAQELLCRENEDIFLRLYNLGVVTDSDMCFPVEKRRRYAFFLFHMNKRINESDQEDGKEAKDRFLRHYLHSQENPLLMARALLVVYRNMSYICQGMYVSTSLLLFIREFCPECNPELCRRMAAEKKIRDFQKRKFLPPLVPSTIKNL